MDEGDLRGKMMEEDHDTLSEVGTRLETHVETGGGNQLLSKAEGEVSEEPPRTPATPETPVGRILRFHTDKGSLPIKKCPKKWKKSTIVLTPPPPLGSFGLF